MKFIDTPPEVGILHVPCDFNACGLSGEEGDNCYYMLDWERVASQAAGDIVFIFDNDISDAGEPEIFGCVAVLEPSTVLVGRGFRARPRQGPWYRGPTLETGPAES